MNLLEIIQEYLRIAGCQGIGKADIWLEETNQDNKWPKGMAEHVRRCFIDPKKVAIEHAKQLLRDWEINTEMFVFKSMSIKKGSVNTGYVIGAYHIGPAETHKHIGFTMKVWINNEKNAVAETITEMEFGVPCD